MNTLNKILTATLLGAALSAGAIAQQDAGKGLMGAMQKGHEKMMSMPMTGKTDVDFAMMMRQHHANGVEMAQVQLQNGKDEKMKQMARKMIDEQKKDIAELDRFLAQNGHGQGTHSMGGSGQPQQSK